MLSCGKEKSLSFCREPSSRIKSSENQSPVDRESQPTPLLSVIVPVYKVEPYLRQALDSLLAQTYTNLEIICVDDGSPDGCPAILDEYARRDSRVVAIHQSNQGVSAARNTGLDRATGEFVAFMDSDDSVAPDAYAKALARMRPGIDMVQFGTELIPADASQKRRVEVEAPSFSRVYEALKRQQRKGVISMNTQAAMNTTILVWDKIYRRSLIERHHLRFPVNLLTEDIYFVRCYEAMAESMFFVEERLYRYLLVERGLSEITRQGKDAKVMGCLKCVNLIFLFYREHELWDRLCVLMTWMLYTLDYLKEHLPDDMQIAGDRRVRDIKQRWREAVNKACPWDDRLQHLLGAMHGWASVRHEWRNWRRYPKDRRRILPGLREFSRPGLRKFFVCGVPVFTVVDVGGRRFFKLFGVKIRKKRIED